MRRDVLPQNSHEEEGGLHAEQTRRGAVSVKIEAARKRKYCTPMECQDREGRNDSLKMGFEELAAIASALQLMGQVQDKIITTDSQASICMIARFMDSPQTLQQCKHKVMLEDIVAQLLAGAPASQNSEGEVAYRNSRKRGGG